MSYPSGESHELKRLPFRGGSLVLLDPCSSREPAQNNLALFDASGCFVWRAELPQSHDDFVDVEIRAGSLIAWTFGGYLVELDTETGRILQSTFTK